jgi:hypothetical protein
MRGKGSNRTAAWMAACSALAAALTLALSACGGDSPEATANAGTPTVEKTPEPAAATTGGSCANQVGTFLDSMAALRTSLVAGLSYEQYVGEVQSIRGVYHRVPVDELALGCLKAAGTPGESGLNKYIEAGDAWTECVETPGCESATVEPALQSRWRQASKLLSKAQQGLKETRR